MTFLNRSIIFTTKIKNLTTMKFLITIAPLALVILLINCSKSSTPATPVVGKWTITSTVTAGCTNTSSNGTKPCTSNCSITTFASNNTYTIVDGTSGATIATGTYSISGTRLTMTKPGSNPIMYTFTLPGNTLVIVGDPIDSSECYYTYTFVRS